MTDRFPMVRLDSEDTQKAQVIYLDVLEKEGLQSTAILAANVTKGIVDRWRESDEDFADREATAMLGLDDEVRMSIRDGVRARDYNMTALAARRLDEYRKQTVEHKHSGTISHEVYAKLPKEDQDQIIREAAAIIELEKKEDGAYGG